MSNELRMSDYFKLPVSDDLIGKMDHSQCVKFVSDGVSEFESVAHAINSHDSMKDQITQLEKDKAELVEALQNYVDAIGNDRGLAAIGKCFKPAKELLERMR